MVPDIAMLSKSVTACSFSAHMPFAIAANHLPHAYSGWKSQSHIPQSV